MKIPVNRYVLEGLKPCQGRFDNYLKHYFDFSGDLVEFLQLDKISISDRIWVGVRLLPRFELEVFAIDCAFSAAEYAADTAHAADAASAAAYAAYATNAAASAAAYAAYATNAAAYAAEYSTIAAARAAHAADAASAAAYDAERDRQLEALIYLTESLTVNK
jgi:hypothetical protein